jgi:hypothetical protein
MLKNSCAVEINLRTAPTRKFDIKKNNALAADKNSGPAENAIESD